MIVDMMGITEAQEAGLQELAKTNPDLAAYKRYRLEMLEKTGVDIGARAPTSETSEYAQAARASGIPTLSPEQMKIVEQGFAKFQGTGKIPWWIWAAVGIPVAMALL